MHDDAINDIGTALLQVRHAFQKHSIPVPDQISYSKPTEARDAKMAMYSKAASSNIMSFRIGQSSRDMDIEIAGFKIFWT